MDNVERIECGNGNCYFVNEGDSTILMVTSRTQFQDKILERCKTKNIKFMLFI